MDHSFQFVHLSNNIHLCNENLLCARYYSWCPGYIIEHHRTKLTKFPCLWGAYILAGMGWVCGVGPVSNNKYNASIKYRYVWRWYVDKGDHRVEWELSLRIGQSGWVSLRSHTWWRKSEEECSREKDQLAQGPKVPGRLVCSGGRMNGKLMELGQVCTSVWEKWVAQQVVTWTFKVLNPVLKKFTLPMFN